MGNHHAEPIYMSLEITHFYNFCDFSVKTHKPFRFLRGGLPWLILCFIPLNIIFEVIGNFLASPRYNFHYMPNPTNTPGLMTTSFVKAFLCRNKALRSPRPWSPRLGRLIKMTLKVIFESDLWIWDGWLHLLCNLSTLLGGSESAHFLGN